jgi:hypothetical protein
MLKQKINWSKDARVETGIWNVGPFRRKISSFQVLKMKCLCPVVLIVCLFDLVANVSAQTKEEFFNLDLYHVNLNLSEEGQSAYWVLLAMDLRNDSSVSAEQRQSLNELLAPIDQINNDLHSEAAQSNPDIRQAILMKLGSATKDPQLASDAFNAIDKSMLTIRLAENNVKFLRQQVQRQGIYDPSLLAAEAISQRLELTHKQNAEIKELRDEFNKKYKAIIDEAKKRQAVTQDEKWRKIMAELDARQRGQVKELIGKPIQWKWNETIPDFFVWTQQGRSAFGEEVPEMTQGKDIHLMNQSELEDCGVIVIDSFLYLALVNENIQRELELTDQQKQRLRQEGINQLGEKSFVTTQYDEQRIAAMLQGEYPLPDKVKDVLLKHQVEWLRHAELQIRLSSHQASFGITHTEMVRTLKLSDNQVSTIDKIATEFDRSFQENAQALKQKLEDLDDSFKRTIYEKLSAQQQAQYTRLTGYRLKGDLK